LKKQGKGFRCPRSGDIESEVTLVFHADVTSTVIGPLGSGAVPGYGAKAYRAPRTRASGSGWHAFSDGVFRQGAGVQVWRIEWSGVVKSVEGKKPREEWEVNIPWHKKALSRTS
jgi:hypothetical protein